MKGNSFKALLATIVVVMSGSLFLLSACGSANSAQRLADSTPGQYEVTRQYLSADFQYSKNAYLNQHYANAPAPVIVNEDQQSIFDVLGSVLDGAKDRVEDAAGAVAGAKDEAERRFSEWQKEREEARARAMDVLENAKLTKKYKKLEYSDKACEPEKLVECSDERVRVTSWGTVDRSVLGVKKVVYTLSYDGQSVDREVEFNVRDTKAPIINLVKKAPKIEVGSSFSPAKNIESVEDPVDGELDLVDKAPKAKGKKAGSEVFYSKGWYKIKGSVDTSKEGVYTIKVSASDANGNTSSRSFDVTVEASSSDSEATQAAAMTRSMAKDQADEENERQAWLNGTVLITPNGKCYHVDGCSYLHRNTSEITRREAKERGLSACTRCKPDWGHPNW